MKTEDKKERDKAGKEGKWRCFSLKDRSVLVLLCTFFPCSLFSHFIPARLTSPLQELPLHIDPLHLACVWDILSIVISL